MGERDESARIADAVLAWGERHRRDLPWRRTRDPWAVLVSEVMLQQTQVARVAEPYDRFLSVFPTTRACAAAPVADVVRAWHGLGYNRRAVRLHACAVRCVEVHGGEVPDDLDALLALPGVGTYTARAVLAFAYGRDVAAVDTNGVRVLARAVKGGPLTSVAAHRLGDSLLPAGAGWSFGQAVFDLGAAHCRRDPRCAGCPVQLLCVWHAAGRPLPDPASGSFAGSSRQGPFRGSDREGRGRLVDALRRAPVRVTDLADVMGWPDDAARAASVAAGVVADGLAVRRGETFSLGE